MVMVTICKLYESGLVSSYIPVFASNKDNMWKLQTLLVRSSIGCHKNKATMTMIRLARHEY